MNTNDKTAQDVENANEFESQHIFINVDSNEDNEKFESTSQNDLEFKQQNRVTLENVISTSLNCDTTNCDVTRCDFYAYSYITNVV